jgi:hypothetical protein
MAYLALVAVAKPPRAAAGSLDEKTRYKEIVREPGLSLRFLHFRRDPK